MGQVGSTTRSLVGALAVSLASVAIFAAPAWSQTTTCFGADADAGAEGYNVIVGTEGNDVLTGTQGPDLIVGRGGDDTIDGLGSGDLLCGDDGRDRVLGGDGNDSIDGGAGDDSPGNTINISIAARTSRSRRTSRRAVSTAAPGTT